MIFSRTIFPISLFLTLILATTSSYAQRLVGALSDNSVSITSTFTGQTLTLFGNIEPEVGASNQAVEGPFDVVVVVRGPVQNRVIRHMTNAFGLWLNTEQVTFGNFPSFQWVLTSDRMENIADEDVFAAAGILPGVRTPIVTADGNGDPALMREQLIRLMAQKSLFGIDERGIQFRSSTLYSARISLPANVPPGNFLAQSYLFKNRQLVGQKSESFSVRKTGFERFIGEIALENPALYGAVCVLLAIFTGWLGGVIFRR